MKMFSSRTSPSRAIAYALLVAFTLSQSFPALAQEAAVPQSLRTRFDMVLDLISTGQYAQSEANLRDIIENYQGSDLRKAYDLLVWTVEQDRGREAATEVAREALEIYPDLTNDRINVPQDIGIIYDELRKEMFGALQIEAMDPDLKESPVWLNNEYKGELPLYLDLLRTGEYELKVAAGGYDDHLSTIQISPNRDTVIPITLNKKGQSRWWIVAGAAVTAGVVFLIAGGSSSEDPALQSLPGPPDPPGK